MPPMMPMTLLPIANSPPAQADNEAHAFEAADGVPFVPFAAAHVHFCMIDAEGFDVDLCEAW